jgi:NAD(P)H-binding
MSATPPVAVIGANGAVGRAAVAELAQRGVTPLRLGMRDPSHRSHTAAYSWPESGQLCAVNVLDPYSLAHFMRNTRCVVNAAGPQSVLGQRVLHMALELGLDVVDIGAGSALEHSLYAPVRAVLDCGMVPGLSGALPRWIAAQWRGQGKAPKALRLLVGGRDKLLPTAAYDMVVAVEQRRSAATAVKQTSSIQVPRPQASDVASFACSIDHVVGYDDAELEQLRQELAPCVVAAWAVYPGAASRQTLLKSTAQIEPALAAQQVAAASAADCAGHATFQQLQVDAWSEIVATERDAPCDRLMLRCTDTSALCGAALAVAVMQVLSGKLPIGLHLGAEVLATDAALQDLLTSRCILNWHFGTYTKPQPVLHEQGVL